MAARVARARERQAKRYADLNLESILTNAACPPALLEEVAQPDPEGLTSFATPPTPCACRPAAFIAC
jgi:magnesium chelatase family protein